MGYRDRMNGDGPRKLLALDGGGIRGVLSLEILAAIEDIVRTKLGKDAVLGDYFDYIAGTSTGAIIAAGFREACRCQRSAPSTTSTARRCSIRRSSWTATASSSTATGSSG